ncbi:MAG TPA: MOSC domain-containing protein [Mycobacteriales bacterium]|nr:MOSC domain-containing protein [Mycobacteriales bacterium]
MRVDALWRYPVKSMLGERLQRARLEHRGVHGDRLFAIRDTAGKLGSGKDSRRFRRVEGLRFVRATLDEHGRPRLTLPDGRIADLAALREFLGEPTLTLRPEQDIPHFDDQPLHVVSRQAVDELAGELNEITVDERRFRPNIVIDGADDGWLGRRARIGSALIEFVKSTERCVMVNAAEPGIERSGEVLKTLTRNQDMQFGIYARVVEPGDIAIDDAVELL